MLELASTKELMQELASRYETFVIGLQRPAKVEGPEKKRDFKIRWSGDAFVAAGLCTALIDEIHADRRETEERMREDD